MDKAERADLLRERYRATGGIPYQSSGRRRRFYEPVRGTPISMAWASPTQRADLTALWLTKPDAKAKPVPRTKRSHGEHALTKIAAQLPRKLPRVSLPQ